MEDVVCYVCGLKIEGSSKQRTGRPVQLHKECRELNNAVSLLYNRIAKFKKQKPLKEKKNQIRRTLWNMANGLN
jgi:hypothetical protein